MNIFRIAKAGKVLRTQGVDGTLHILIDQKIKELGKGQALFLWNNLEWVPFFIERLESINEQEYLIKFEDLNAKEAASKFSSHPVSIQADEILSSAEEKHPWADWIVFSEQIGEIGPVVDVQDMSEYLLFTVQHKEKEVLIPVHEDLILNLNEEERTMLLALPDGLLD